MSSICYNNEQMQLSYQQQPQSSNDSNDTSAVGFRTHWDTQRSFSGIMDRPGEVVLYFTEMEN